MTSTDEQKNHLRVRGWVLGISVLALLLTAALLRILPLQNSPISHDSRFVITTRPSIGLPTNATLRQRAFTWWFQIQQGFHKPHPLAYSFPANPTNRCSIQGLLNQCMELTGMRYVIPKDVAAGTVQFGHTNTLNGAQWAMAFTDTLQNGQPEWWDSNAKRFCRENLVLLTNGARTVLVLPEAMVREFQNKGAQ